MENSIKLRNFRDEDMTLFKKWLYTSHVAKWYHEPLDWIDEVEKRNSEFNWIDHYIVECDNKAIGFCQFYEYCNSGETWHGNVNIKDTYSIDYMIGESDYLGKKLGKKIVDALVLEISKKENAKKIIVQPEKENKASCNLLLSCGFEFDTQNEIYIFKYF